MKQALIDLLSEEDIQSLPVTARLDELRRNPYIKKAWLRSWECRSLTGWEKIPQSNLTGLR